MHPNRFSRFLWLAGALLVLAGCASSHTLTGNPRPAIDPAEVRLYFGPPAGGYEEIARLNVSSGAFTYGEQNKANAIEARLRREAARLGANGVLFQGTADGYGNSGVSVGGGVGRGGGRSFSSVGVGVNISPTQKYANGIAIHVPNPPPLQAPPPQE
ncbi:hypothetical protein E2F46_02585 [Luteimonas aestuarii]|uniref:DUF4156 domain-containing protein n=1 Tax=Luteimonas aestuarii TaxID=453837 RepID=A0A4R5U0M9_9GAMM|nr:hypothetical protein [Luteimonas aestuarii]TDK27120.1 hypothetical protein E2F46_02585 [Luteimonas aestuarii]